MKLSSSQYSPQTEEENMNVVSKGPNAYPTEKDHLKKVVFKKYAWRRTVASYSHISLAPLFLPIFNSCLKLLKPMRNRSFHDV